MKNETQLLEKMLGSLQSNLPDVFSRKAVPDYFGKTISVGTIANLGADGPPFVRNGRNAIYEKESFLKWFRRYLEGGIKAVKTPEETEVE